MDQTDKDIALSQEKNNPINHGQSTSEININFLPPELLIIILHHLELEDILSTRLVCRKWNAVIIQILNKEDVIEELVIKDKTQFEALVSIVAAAKKKLSFSWPIKLHFYNQNFKRNFNREFFDYIVEMLENARNQQQNNKKNVSVSSYLNVINALSSIHMIDLNNTGIATVPDEFNNVYTLDLGCNSSISEISQELISGNVHILILEHTQIKSIPRPGKNLKFLNISGTPITAVPSELGSLQGVGISFTNIVDIAPLARVPLLNLAGTRVANFSMLTEAVKELDISHWRGDKTEELLAAENLRVFSSIEKLYADSWLKKAVKEYLKQHKNNEATASSNIIAEQISYESPISQLPDGEQLRLPVCDSTYLDHEVSRDIAEMTL